MSKRARSSNFTQECTFNLVNIIDKYRGVIENKRTDSVMWQEKKTAWIRIANEFNYTAIEKRTPEQLKQKYETLKKEARKEASKLLLSPQENAVAQSPKEKSLPLYAKIRSMMEQSPTEYASIHGTEPMEPLGTQIHQCESSISQAEEEEEEDSDDDDVIEVLGPAVVMNDDCEAVIPSASVTADPDDGTRSYPVNHALPESFSTQGANGPHLGLEGSRKRKRPEDNKSSHKHVFKCRNLRSLMLAKEEMVSLQKDLLLKEFRERDKRERELHQVNISIKQVQLKNEELENQIKVQKLRKLIRENQDLEMATQWK